MTSTKALARLYKKIIGKETSKNTPAKTMVEMADSWKLPPVPKTPGTWSLKVTLDDDNNPVYKWDLYVIDIK